MICIKCGSKIPETSKSIKYCSERCSRLYLKSLYRKRNAEKFNKYRRDRRKKGYKNFYKDSQKDKLIVALKSYQGGCLKCGSKENLEIHHIRPRMLGGEHNMGNVMLLCKKCHYDFENLTRGFWSTN